MNTDNKEKDTKVSKKDKLQDVVLILINEVKTLQEQVKMLDNVIVQNNKDIKMLIKKEWGF